MVLGFELLAREGGRPRRAEVGIWEAAKVLIVGVAELGVELTGRSLSMLLPSLGGLCDKGLEPDFDTSPYSDEEEEGGMDPELDGTGLAKVCVGWWRWPALCGIDASPKTYVRFMNRGSASQVEWGSMGVGEEEMLTALI